MIAAAPATARNAALSLGQSADGITAWAAQSLLDFTRPSPISCLVDVGCGHGNLGARLQPHVRRCIGLDAVAYSGLAQRPWIEFRPADLNAVPFPVPTASADAVAAVEIIEHLENPRALVRELARIARPGGVVMVTTPNQLSWLSKLSLLFKDEFHAFQEAPGLYPTHISALLASDLRRIATECGLVDAQIRYSGSGRLPGSSRGYPGWVARRWPRSASDNVMLLARRGRA